MKNLYWWILGAVFLVVLSLALVFGVRPKPRGVIKPSNFETGHIVGQTIYKQLYLRFEPFQILLFGEGDKVFTQEVLFGFLRESRKFGPGVDRIIAIEDLEGVEEVEVTRISRTSSVLVEVVRQALDANERVLIYGLAGDTPHFHPDNLVNYLEKKLKTKALSFSFTNFNYVYDVNGINEVECRRNSKEGNQFGHLSCLAVRKSKWLKRNRKVDINKPVVTMERVGELDYVIYSNKDGR